MPRLFIAIELPDELKRALGRLQVDLPGGRWVPRDQLHLTLAFLGNQEENLIERLKGTLSTICEDEFRIVFSTTGAFPNVRRPRVIWVGVQPERRLERLAERVRDVVASCCVLLEDRPFTPHITLARFKGPTAGSAISEWVRDVSPEVNHAMDVSEFILYESRLTSGGAVHTPLARFPLRSH